MTWAKDKEKIISVILGILATVAVASGAMLIAHEKAISTIEAKIEANSKAIDRIYDDTSEIKRDIKEILKELRNY